MSYIYLIQEKNFVKKNESIYKIGLTKESNPFDILNNYSNGYQLLLMRNVQLYIEKYNIPLEQIESKIIEYFCNTFKQKLDIGREYFEGDIEDMIMYIKTEINGLDLDINMYISKYKLSQLTTIIDYSTKKCIVCGSTFRRKEHLVSHVHTTKHYKNIENYLLKLKNLMQKKDKEILILREKLKTCIK